MQKFIFENARGVIEIGKFKNYIFDSYDFGGETSYQRESYSGLDGDVIISTLYEPRTITINGHIMAYDQKSRFSRRHDLFRVMDGKTAGTLTYKNDVGSWVVNAVPRLPVVGSTKGRNIAQFALYFEAPSFYWESSESNTVPLYSRENLITFPFTLPAVFTQRIMSAVAVNSGSLETPPVILINCTATADAVLQDSGGSLTVKVENAAGNTQSICINYVPSAGETITIDCEKMSVTSSTAGNLIKYVSIDSDFPVIGVGDNVVTLLNSTGKIISATMTWRDREVGI